MRVVFICIAFLLYNVATSNAQENYSALINPNHGGEAYLRIQEDQIDDLKYISSLVSLDHVHENGFVYGYANFRQLEKLLELKPDVEFLPHPGTLSEPVMKGVSELSSIDDWDFYPTYEAYLEMMYQFEEDFPGLCQVVSIGQSNLGREILFAVIKNNQNSGEVPQFMYTSSMHGDETAGYILMLRLIDYLLNHYGSDQLVTSLVDGLEIWINPLANPDGTYASGNSSVFGATRGNANLIDLNRNYPDPEDGDHPDGNEWQTETVHFMQLAEENNFVVSANIHGGSEVCNYPWDTWPKLHADDQWWQYVCRAYADTAHVYAPPTYLSGFNNGITNGYQWYTISGGRQDYMNYFHHCREFTLEISNIKLLPANMLNDWWEYNYRSLLQYMEQTLFGIKGQISDSLNGKPLKASVFIENHDEDGSWVVSYESSGRYFRPVFEGTYDLTFFRPGYETKTIESVPAINRGQTVVDVQLLPTQSSLEETKIKEWISIANNPGNGTFILNYSGEKNISFNIELFTLSGKKIAVEGKVQMNPMERYSIQIQDQPAGIYLLGLESSGRQVWFKLLKND